MGELLWKFSKEDSPARTATMTHHVGYLKEGVIVKSAASNSGYLEEKINISNQNEINKSFFPGTRPIDEKN